MCYALASQIPDTILLTEVQNTSVEEGNRIAERLGLSTRRFTKFGVAQNDSDLIGTGLLEDDVEADADAPVSLNVRLRQGDPGCIEIYLYCAGAFPDKASVESHRSHVNETLAKLASA